VSWVTASLSELSLVFTDGDWIESKDQSPSGIRLIQTGNVGIGEFKDRGEKARYISPDTFRRLRCEEIFAGDCLISRLPDPVGRACIIPASNERLITAVDCTIVRFDPKKLIPEFFKYFSQSAAYLAEVDAACTGATRKRISRSRLGDIRVPLPTLAEQNRIVAILDEAFDGIDTAVANTEKNLANARDLLESRLRHTFDQRGQGWTEKTLHEVSLEFGRGKSKHRPRNDPKLYGGPYPFIQTGDVRNCDHVILESSQSYSVTGLAQSKLWPKGTICITIAANIAETGILGFDACFPDSVIGIVVDPKQTTTDFVEYLLQSVKVQLKAQGKGSAQDNINLATFENRLFPFPPLEEQKRLVVALNELSDNIRAVEAVYRGKINALAELKQSILCKAFAGELTAHPEKALQEAAE
jgi:type I restriction enzyme S subunit